MPRLRGERRQQDEKVEIGTGRGEVGAASHFVEAFGYAVRRRRDADHAHAERLALGGEVERDGADAENPDRLAVDQGGRPAVPLALLLHAQRARQAARQRQHGEDRRFRQRRAVDASDIGDDHFGPERRQVDQVVDAGAEPLHPFEPGRLGQHLVPEHGGEGDQDLGLADLRFDLGMVIDQVEADLRKAGLQAIAIGGGHVLGQAQKNDGIGHRADKHPWLKGRHEAAAMNSMVPVRRPGPDALLRDSTDQVVIPGRRGSAGPGIQQNILASGFRVRARHARAPK